MTQEIKKRKKKCIEGIISVEGNQGSMEKGGEIWDEERREGMLGEMKE